MLGLGVFAAPAHARTAGLYWGATIGSQYDGGVPPWDMGALTGFERLTHKAPSTIHFYIPFAYCHTGTCDPATFPTSLMAAIRDAGSIPLLNWGSRADTSPAHDGAYSLAHIIDGSLDPYLRRWAAAAKAWGHPFFLLFDWEMNGNWYPWGLSVNGVTAAQQVRAWRHVHDIFAAAGASNVTWVWCPIAQWGKHLAQEFPGSRYVDWTCLDGYNYGLSPGGAGKWLSFSQLFGADYQALLRLAPGKPEMIGEFASSTRGGSKAGWIRNALSVVRTRFPKIRAIGYFDDVANGVNWELRWGRSAAAAFAAGIANGAYTANRFAHSGHSVIKPL